MKKDLKQYKVDHQEILEETFARPLNKITDETTIDFILETEDPLTDYDFTLERYSKNNYISYRVVNKFFKEENNLTQDIPARQLASLIIDGVDCLSEMDIDTYLSVEDDLTEIINKWFYKKEKGE